MGTDGKASPLRWLGAAALAAAVHRISSYFYLDTSHVMPHLSISPCSLQAMFNTCGVALRKAKLMGLGLHRKAWSWRKSLSRRSFQEAGISHPSLSPLSGSLLFSSCTSCAITREETAGRPEELRTFTTLPTLHLPLSTPSSQKVGGSGERKCLYLLPGFSVEKNLCYPVTLLAI